MFLDQLTVQFQFEELVSNLVFEQDIKITNSTNGNKQKVDVSQKVQALLVVPNEMSVDEFVAKVDLVPVKLLNYVVVPTDVKAENSKQFSIQATIVNLNNIKTISIQ